MSASPYKLDHAAGVPEQIESIKAVAKKAGRYVIFVGIMKEAIRRLETDPQNWGDPEYRAKTVDAVAYRGIIRPIVFQYVIYEQIRGVVLTNVKLFVDFS